jgi:hypothetical protein
MSVVNVVVRDPAFVQGQRQRVYQHRVQGGSGVGAGILPNRLDELLDSAIGRRSPISMLHNLAGHHT